MKKTKGKLILADTLSSDGLYQGKSDDETRLSFPFVPIHIVLLHFHAHTQFLYSQTLQILQVHKYIYLISIK